MKKIILSLSLLLVMGLQVSKSQDTITFMQYNLLNYGNLTYYCPADSNDASLKNGWIKTIFDYVKPTIFTVNEMNYQTKFQDSLLHNVMNVNGINYYKLAPVTNIAYTSLINTMYYDSRKVECCGRYVAQTHVRDATVYKMYYKSPDIEQGDTVYFYCILVHLKAGSDDGNDTSRAIMTENLMSWLQEYDSAGTQNFMIMGDFNVYTSEELAFQNLVNHQDSLIRFYDPINQLGSWSSNRNFAQYHTQSTRGGSSIGGCASQGGLDDRFDYILVNRNILDNTHRVGYVSGSYRNIGNDGNHFNQSLGQDGNNSVPASVLNALYRNSDHLPITLKLAIDATPVVSINDVSNVTSYVSITPNPVSDILKVNINNVTENNFTINIITSDGKIAFSENHNESQFDINVNTLHKGTYVLQIVGQNKNIIGSKTFIKQ